MLNLLVILLYTHCGIKVAINKDMMIAIANWQGSVSPVFDVSDRLCLVYIENGRELRREDILLKNRNPFLRAKEMAGIGVELLICGAVSHVLETALISAGIRVIGFACGNLEDVLGAFMRGQLTGRSFFMPGCFGGRKRYRFQHRRGRKGPL